MAAASELLRIDPYPARNRPEDPEAVSGPRAPRDDGIFLLMTIFADLLLVIAAFLGAQLAVAWGELGSYPLHGDKSGMAGFGAVIILMPMRWLAVAVALAIGVGRAGLPLAMGRRAQVGLVLVLHLALGVVAYRVFEWITGAIQRDVGGPQKVAILFGLGRAVSTHFPHSSIRAPMLRASICSFASGRSGCT